MSKLWIRRWYLISFTVLLAGGAWMVLSAVPPGSGQVGPIIAPQEGFQAPDFSLQTPEGVTVQLSSLRGKPVLVNLWASWCSPCKAEMAAIQQAYTAYHPEGFEVLAVNSTFQDSADAAVTFAREESLTFPVLFDGQGEVSKLYRLQALPTSFFIDRQGVIRKLVIGGPMSEALVRSQVEQLLSEK